MRKVAGYDLGASKPSLLLCGFSIKLLPSVPALASSDNGLSTVSKIIPLLPECLVRMLNRHRRKQSRTGYTVNHSGGEGRS